MQQNLDWSTERTVELGDVRRYLRRRWLFIAACAATALALGALGAWLITPAYQATAVLRIDDRQTSLPVLDALKSLSDGQTMGSELETQLVVLRSRSLAARVVDSLGLRATVETSPVDHRARFRVAYVAPAARPGSYRVAFDAAGRPHATDASTGARVEASSDAGALTAAGVTLVPIAPGATARPTRLIVRSADDAVAAVQRALTVERPAHDANVVEVRFRDADPARARDVPNVLTGLYIAQRHALQTLESRGTTDLLRGQLDTLSAQLAGAERELRTFRETSHATNLATQSTAQTTQLVAMQAERNNIEAERAALARLLAQVADSVGALPNAPSPYRRLIAFPTLLRNQAASELLRALNTAEDARSSLASRRKSVDPDLVALTSRVSQTEEQLRSIAVTYLQGLSNQVAALDSSLRASNVELSTIPAKEIELARLERRPKALADMFTTLQTRLKEAEIAQAIPDASVEVIDAAALPTRASSPNGRLLVALAGTGGLLFGCVVAFVSGYSDRTVRTREDIARVAGWPVRALIPNDPTRRRAADGRLIGRPGSGPVHAMPLPARPPIIDDAIRGLRTQLTLAGLGEPGCQVILVTSAMPGDGKSSTSAALAAALAAQGRRVALVDADVRRGHLHREFRVRATPGLGDLASGHCSLAEGLQDVQVPSGTLTIIARGTVVVDTSAMLGGDGVTRLLEELRRHFDVVVVDSPPMNVVTDALVLSRVSDGVLLVVRAGSTTRGALEVAQQQLREARANVMAVVLNDIDVRHDADLYGMNAYDTYYAAVTR